MNTLRWSQLEGAEVASYNVYRSIIGFKSALVSLGTLSGKTLTIRIDGGLSQTFSFDGTTPVVDLINETISGGTAHLSADGLSFFVRSNNTCDGSVEIVGGSALTDLGLTPRVITEKSENELIATVTAPVDPLEAVEYEDLDGASKDWYRLTTVDELSAESDPTDWIQPILASGTLCVIEGLVTDLQGARVPDAQIIATIQVPPERDTLSSFITKDPVTALTNPSGRFSLPLIQGALVRLEIPAIGYSRNITVPEKAYVDLRDLTVDLCYQLDTLQSI